MRVAVAALCAALAAGPARAEPKAVPLYAGEQATFDGLLVPPGRMVELNEAELRADELSLRLESSASACRRIEAVYVARLEKATAPPAWYETPRFAFWAGVTVGILASGAAVWGASALSR